MKVVSPATETLTTTTTTTNLEERVHVLDAHLNVWTVITEIATSGLQEEAFYVCDIGDIVRKYKLWNTVLPRVKPYYAVKCNDSLTVLEVLAAMGAGFDCASKSEINKVLSLGAIDSNRIIFANPAKPASHIRHAALMNVATMTFDNETELHKVKKLYPNAKLVIRIRCDASEAQCQLGMKFGCDPVTEAPQLLCCARALGLDVIGVSFHVGSGCREPAVYRRAIRAARDLFDYAAATLDWHFDLLDIGGGYPGGGGGGANNNLSIHKIAEVINFALDDYFPETEGVRVIAEPGRFFVSSAYTLACNIHSIRNVIQKKSTSTNEGVDDVVDETEDEKRIHRMYFIDDGVYGSFNCILYDHQIVVPQPLLFLPPDNDESKIRYYSSSIWGPTCDGLDKVIDDVRLPEMQIGDWIVFEDMGAYTLPVASPFNGFPIPKVHIVADEATWRMLRGILPLTEAHFVIGNTAENMRMGLIDSIGI